MPAPTVLTVRQRILAAAARLFRRRGYAATSVRDIAKEVGLGASSLYNHVDSKQYILHEICFASAAQFETGLTRIERSDLGFAERLRALIGLHVELALSRPETVTVFNDEWQHLNEPALSQFLRKRREYEARVAAMLRRSRSTRELAVEVPEDVAVSTLLASLSWVYSLRDAPSHRVERLTAEIYGLWSTGWL